MGAQQRLLALVFARIGATGPTAAARVLHLDVSAPSKLGRWVREEHEPPLSDAMMLLGRAGLLQPEAVAAWEKVSLEEARRRVDERRRDAGARVDAEADRAGQAVDQRLRDRERRSKRRRGAA